MTSKTKNIVAIAVGAAPAAMVLMSAFMKLSQNPQMVDGLTKGGMGSYITMLGAIEVISVALFFYPKTNKIGFYLLCSYLGGALATELSHGMPPMSALLIALFWVSMFIKDKANFFPASTHSNN
jgi:hypothetical protein